MIWMAVVEKNENIVERGETSILDTRKKNICEARRNFQILLGLNQTVDKNKIKKINKKVNDSVKK